MFFLKKDDKKGIIFFLILAVIFVGLLIFVADYYLKNLGKMREQRQISEEQDILEKNEEDEGAGEGNIQENFLDGKSDILEIYSSTEKVIVESLTSVDSLPKTIWKENVMNGEKKYQVAFERIGLIYEIGSVECRSCADYRLIVKDEEGSVVSSQIFVGYPVSLEEVYWFKDISGDGFPDVILCTFYLDVDLDEHTDLYFMIWNSEKSVYESKPLPWNKTLNRPVWKEEMSSIIFSDMGGKTTMKMFSIEDGEWQLCGELVEDDKAEKNSILETYYNEFFYMDGQTIKNDIKVVWPEDTPWTDADSIWCMYNSRNELLFPSYVDWKTIEEELSDDKTIQKYVRRHTN